MGMKNSPSNLSVIAASFISTLFLSLLCSLSFNLWVYEIKETVLEEGDWQGRITGEINEKELSLIECFANVERAVVNQDLSGGQTLTVDIYFRNMRAIYEELPLIAERLGLEDSAIAYHETLLSDYLIHDPQDDSPPLLLTFYLRILFMVSLSLILIIHNSFAVSMDARVRQFGIFSSIGATPGQIRLCLLGEAAALCVLPVSLGIGAGIGLGFGVLWGMNLLAFEIAGRHEAVFCYHPMVFLVTMAASVLTVFVSAWLPAVKLSKLTPLQAIRSEEELQLKKRARTPVLPWFFGIEGELAGNALKAQKKALRTSALSLTLSFLGFTVMLCFFTLSGISTDHTYFERYQDAWDVMVTVKDTGIENFEKGDDVRNLPGVENVVVYQKAEALCRVSRTMVSRDAEALGGLEAIAGIPVSDEWDSYFVQAALVIMDDESFAEYCEQLGILPDGNGSIVLNRIWDSIHSNFRYKEYIPFIEQESETLILQNTEQPEKSLEISVLGFAQEAPVLREEYDDYTLVQFLPLSLWEQISGQIGNAEEDMYIRVLAKDRETFAKVEQVETDVFHAVNGTYTVEMENRMQEKAENDRIIHGYMIVIGAFCALLAAIGIANVFSNTLSFLRRRKREFARYLSVGMTPKEMRKMFCVEALVLAGRPVLITLPLTVLFVGLMIRASYLKPMEFLVKAPYIPILIFILTIFGFVGLAYYLGGRKLLACSLAEALKDD